MSSLGFGFCSAIREIKKSGGPAGNRNITVVGMGPLISLLLRFESPLSLT